MDVLILAAGLSTRLSKFTHNLLPKYLIDLDGYNGLYYLIKYWKKYSNKIFLVIHSKYNLITKSYIKNILEDYINKIIIINYDTSDGTAYTLNKILNSHLNSYSIKNLLITWCDIYPLDNFSLLKTNNQTNNIHIFTYGNECRYILDNKNKINESDNGNIVGIYYFENYRKINLEELTKEDLYGKDIVEYLKYIGNIYNYKINNIFDYGDESKLLKILSNNLLINSLNKFKHRYFNKIEIINEDKLLKKSVNNKGYNIISFEKKWHLHINKLSNNESVKSLLPEIYEILDDGFVMEYKKNYISVYEYLKNNNELNINENILDNIILNINKIHCLDKKEIDKNNFYDNLKKEINDKLYDRKLLINDYLDYFSNIKIVNDIKIDSFDTILLKCKKIIYDYYENKNEYIYSIILGDSQFSNILIDKNDITKICFIDPRGYFGNSKIYGPIEYDYAKILYAISGYDFFNNNYFNLKDINIDPNKSFINFEIEKINYSKEILDKYFEKVHEAFVVLIWLSLPEYNKNNIWKCIGSYYYGLYLGTLL